MKYLVTGGAGFIGSHLAQALLDRGDHVTVLDNFSTGRIDNLREVKSRLDLVQGSVLDSVLLDELAAESEVIVHLAAAVGVRLIVEHPLRSLLTNVRGSENVLEAAHRYRCKVLLASTSEIYGKNSRGPFREEDDRVLGSPKVSRWAYSTSKAVDEILAYAYYREKGLATIVIRLFNTVGPRQTGAYGMVLPRLVLQALQNQPLTVFGDGRQTRCFCDVSDVVRAILALLEEPQAEGDVFNVGSTEEVSILELAERVIEATSSSSQIDLIPYDEAYEEGFEDMRRRVPDITKIRNLVGWAPQLTLEDIITNVVAEAREAQEEASRVLSLLLPAEANR